jgi:hypothetical protein
MLDLNLPRILLSLALVGAVGCDDPDRADPPPVNAAISNAQGPADDQPFVTCEGPDDELALLGGLCQWEIPEMLGWSFLDGDGDGMGLLFGDGPHLMLYARIDREPEYQEQVAGELRYAAYVRLAPVTGASPVERLELWTDAEAVDAGEVHTEHADFDVCAGDSWRGRGTFQWRSTTIRVRWSATHGC